MVRDFLDTRWCDAAATQHVGQKWPDVSGPVRPAEGDDEDPVEWLSHGAGIYCPCGIIAEARMSVTQYRRLPARLESIGAARR